MIAHRELGSVTEKVMLRIQQKGNSNTTRGPKSKAPQPVSARVNVIGDGDGLFLASLPDTPAPASTLVVAKRPSVSEQH